MNKHLERGQLLVELLIVMALVSLILPALIGTLIITRQSEPQRNNRIIAEQQLHNYTEAIRAIRQQSWDAIAIPGTYHIAQSGNTWELLPGDQTEQGFTHLVLIEEVERDANGVIVPSGGTPDTSTRRVVVSVLWDEPQPQSVSTTLLLTRYLDNDVHIDDTEADFLAGNPIGTAVVDTAGGQVILGSGGAGDWCKPGDFVIAELNLSQSGKARSVAAVEGKAFTGTDTFFDGSFFEIDITQDSPPVFSIVSSLPGYSTNDVFVDGSYAYVAVDDPFNIYNRDVIIVDLTTNSIVGWFDTSGWVGGSGVYVQNNIGYVTTGNYLRTFDLSQKTGSRPQLDSVRLENSFLADLFVRGQKVVVTGDYAYVAILGWSNYELRLVNVANPSNISRGARANVNGDSGRELFVNETGTRAYLATGLSSTLDEFFIINTDFSAANKNNASFNLPTISSYDSNGMNPRGVKAVPGNKALLVGLGGEEYQVLDISNESSITRCGGMSVDAGIYGVAAVLETDGDAYSYIVTEDPANEFKAILGGPGGQYASDGIFESEIFDAGHATAFNYAIASFTRPANTTASFQVAIANPADGNCETASYQYVGEDGTSSMFYADEGAIFWGSTGGGFENPGRCMRYRVYLESTDSSATPILDQMIINYSP